MTPAELDEVAGCLEVGDRLFVKWRENPYVYAVELIRPLRADPEGVLHVFLIDPTTDESIAPYMLVSASDLVAAARTRDGIEGPSERL